MAKSKIVVGSRGSALAITQTNLVIDSLKEHYPDTEFEILRITTKGDRILDKTLSKIGGKGLFINEIEAALTEGRIDLAIHSVKDMPSVINEGFELASMPLREDVRDVLITRDNKSLDELRQGAVIGSSSLRRGAQILALRPDLQIKPLRGNVETRIKKIETENLDGIILAAAGLNRLNLNDKISYYFELNDMIPAVGQGALGIEIREGDAEVREMVAKIADLDTTICVEAEREFMRILNGGCHVPIGAVATIEDGELEVTGMVASCDGSKILKSTKKGKPSDYKSIAEVVSQEIIDLGAKKILDELNLNND